MLSCVSSNKKLPFRQSSFKDQLLLICIFLRIHAPGCRPAQLQTLPRTPAEPDASGNPNGMKKILRSEFKASEA